MFKSKKYLNVEFLLEKKSNWDVNSQSYKLILPFKSIVQPFFVDLKERKGLGKFKISKNYQNTLFGGIMCINTPSSSSAKKKKR